MTIPSTKKVKGEDIGKSIQNNAKPLNIIKTITWETPDRSDWIMQSVVKHFPCLLTVDTEHCEVILNFEIHNTYLYFKRKTCRCLFNKTFLYCIVL